MIYSLIPLPETGSRPPPPPGGLPPRVYVCVVCGIQLTSMDHVRWVGRAPSPPSPPPPCADWLWTLWLCPVSRLLWDGMSVSSQSPSLQLAL